MAWREYLNIGKLLVRVIQFNEVKYNDYLVAGNSIGTKPTTNPPALAVIRDNLEQYQFEKDDQGFFTLHILHDFKAGSIPTFHCHWTHNEVAPSGDVVWKIEYSIIRGYEQDQFPASRTMSSVQTAESQYTHHITPDDMPLLDTDDLEIDAVLIGRVYRGNAGDGDTFNGDPFLLQIDMHYEMGQVGTIERNRPFKSAGFDPV